jgi:hypothetical protein
MNQLLEVRNAMATAHYYLNKARGEFCDAIDATDASGPGEKFNPREEAAHSALIDAEQAALDAADDLLEALGANICADCAAELLSTPIATSRPQAN